MISLAIPLESENNYLSLNGMFVGPFGPNCAPFIGENVDFDLAKGKLFWQRRGIFHENNVGNDSIKGVFDYTPLYLNPTFVAKPTAQFPTQESVQLANFYGTIAARLAEFGIFSSGKTGLRYNLATNPTAVTHFEFYSQLGYPAWYEVTINLKSPNFVSYYYKYEIYSYTNLGGGAFRAAYRRTQYTNSLGASGWNITGFTLPQKWGAIQMIGPAKASAPFLGTQGCTLFTDKTPHISNINLKLQAVSMLIDQYWPGMFPIKDKDYGTLAQEASQKVIANKVNMIMFLKELKDPSKMIPKLKNLKKLKSWSDDYLSLKYGAQLTVADLKRIWSAFKTVKPYLDKNGFKSYSAGYISHLTEGNSTYTLEQHIKLGIDNEDNALQALEQGMENIGFLPTLENVWDMIPYSFVVDWFVSIGDLLETLDSRQRLQRLNIRYVTSSRKATVSKNIRSGLGQPYSGNLVWVHYHRWVSDQCPVPPLSLLSEIADFDHWIEGAALIISGKKSRR